MEVVAFTKNQENELKTCSGPLIGLITVFDAILTVGKIGQKLQ